MKTSPCLGVVIAERESYWTAGFETEGWDVPAPISVPHEVVRRARGLLVWGSDVAFSSSMGREKTAC